MVFSVLRIATPPKKWFKVKYGTLQQTPLHHQHCNPKTTLRHPTSSHKEPCRPCSWLAPISHPLLFESLDESSSPQAAQFCAKSPVPRLLRMMQASQRGNEVRSVRLGVDRDKQKRHRFVVSNMAFNVF